MKYRHSIFRFIARITNAKKISKNCPLIQEIIMCLTHSLKLWPMKLKYIDTDLPSVFCSPQWDLWVLLFRAYKCLSVHSSMMFIGSALWWLKAMQETISWKQSSKIIWLVEDRGLVRLLCLALSGLFDRKWGWLFKFPHYCSTVTFTSGWRHGNSRQGENKPF